MAYVKTNWQTGDVITAAKLNNMETGIYDATEAAAAAFAPDIDDPQDGDVIKYDSTAEKWVNGAAAAAFDPDIDDPQDGQVLVYDGTAEKWVNGAGEGSGLVVPLITLDMTNLTITMDMSFADVLAAIENNKCCYAHVNAGAGNLQVFHLDNFVPSDSSSQLSKQFSFTYNDVGTIPGLLTPAQPFKMSIAFVETGDKLLTLFTESGSTQIIPPTNP